jgi:hypothetical protein
MKTEIMRSHFFANDLIYINNNIAFNNLIYICTTLFRKYVIIWMNVIIFYAKKYHHLETTKKKVMSAFCMGINHKYMC